MRERHNRFKTARLARPNGHSLRLLLGAPIFPLSLIDLQILLSYARKPINLPAGGIEDYTVLIPLYNSPRYFKNKIFTDTIKDRTILCVSTSNAEMERFAGEMEQDGYSVIRIKENPESPWQVLRLALNPQLILLQEALPLVSTRYLVFLDGDTVPQQDLGRACAAIDGAGYDLASVNVVPSSTDSSIAKLQRIEYYLEMRTRNFRPWLTSGACIVGRTDTMRLVMDNHTTFFYGGDIEIGRQGKTVGRVCHLNFTVSTEVPSSFTGWFRQRIGWWAGAFRLGIVNFDKNLSSPLWLFYGSVIIWGLLALRWFDSIRYWYILGLLFALYWPLNLAVGWRFRSRWLLVYPLYAFFQSLVLPPFGLVRYARHAWRTKNAGRLRHMPHRDGTVAGP